MGSPSGTFSRMNLTVKDFISWSTKISAAVRGDRKTCRLDRRIFRLLTQISMQTIFPISWSRKSESLPPGTVDAAYTNAQRGLAAFGADFIDTL